MKKIINYILTFTVGIMLASHSYAKKIDKLNIFIPPVGVGLLMVDAVKDQELKKYVKDINVVRWNNPDQLRAGIIDGSIDITFVPSYVSANFYNKGIKFKMLNIVTGGILYIISTDKSIKTIQDLKGKTVVVPFQNDMPDLVLKAMIKKLKLNNVNIKYVATPTVAVKMALSGKADTLLIPEVAGTKIQMIAKKKKGITFYRSINLSKEYGKIFNTKPYIPQAGVAIREEFANKHSDFLKAFNKAMKKSADALLSDKNRVVKVTNSMWKNQGEIFAKSIKHWNIQVDSTSKVKPEIEFFYNVMYDLKPAIIGGKLPDNDFYMDY